jgi:hypothetical protein
MWAIVCVNIEQEFAMNMQDSTKPVLAMRLQKLFDGLFYVFGLLMLIGLVMIAIVGLNIPSEYDARHTDINYPLSFRVLPIEVVENGGPQDTAKISEIIQGQAEIKLNNTFGKAAWYISNAIYILQALVVLITLHYLRKLFANFAQRRFFDAVNATYIRRIAFILIGTCIVYPLVIYLGGQMILNDIGSFNAQIELAPSVSIPITGFVVGLALLVLSQLIDEAVDIYNEQALTI